MNSFDEYIHEGDPGKREKSYAWKTAIGLQAVDRLRTSEYLAATARKDIEGTATIDEVDRIVRNYYQSKAVREETDEDTREADLAAVNIRRLLTEQTFAFSLVGLTSIHRRIFDGVYKFAGKIRDYNITKKEWVLRGDTVLYVSAPDIRRAVEYDIEQEKAFDYRGLNPGKIVEHIANFVSGLWQIHPFGEGNTRATAVFAIKYLRSMGFDVGNDLFADHSWYFRNALVRANYQNLKRGIVKDNSFLTLFFRNLLLCETNVLKNRNMLVNAEGLFESIEQEPNKSNNNLTDAMSSLLKAINREQLTVRQIMEKMELKHRSNFVAKYLNPAIREGLVAPIYPDKPNHPRQKYYLTVKAIMIVGQL